jgi:hypothetical protein
MGIYPALKRAEPAHSTHFHAFLIFSGNLTAATSSWIHSQWKPATVRLMAGAHLTIMATFNPRFLTNRSSNLDVLLGLSFSRDWKLLKLSHPYPISTEITHDEKFTNFWKLRRMYSGLFYVDLTILEEVTLCLCIKIILFAIKYEDIFNYRLQEEGHMTQISTTTVSLLNGTWLSWTYLSGIFIFHTTHPIAEIAQWTERQATGWTAGLDSWQGHSYRGFFWRV